MPIQINRTGPSLAEADYFAYPWTGWSASSSWSCFRRSTTLNG